MSEIKKTILVVEDDKFLRELICQKLKKEGFSISEAVDGEKGLQKVKTEKQNKAIQKLTKEDRE